MILLAGFEKFSNYKINLSEVVVYNFEIRLLGHQVKKLILPVSWKRSNSCYKNFVSQLGKNPDLVILLGIHSGSKIRIERYSWNFSFGLDEDNKFRFCPINLIPKIRFNPKFNINRIKNLKSDEINLEFSSFMGFFLCNYVYFNALLLSAKNYPVIFIHIPDHASLEEIIVKIKRIIFLILES